jgi:hypothetical protein
MTINGEKAPAFSAKTLNLPQAPPSYVNQIIELSRQKYAVERAVVEKIIREGIENRGKSPAQLQQPPQLDRPKAQAQLNQVEQYQSQADHTKAASGLIKAITGGGTNETGSMQIQEPPLSEDSEEPAKKRKRTRRGGKKHKKKQQEDSTATPSTTKAAEQVIRPAPQAKPAQSLEDERTIRLR